MKAVAIGSLSSLISPDTFTGFENENTGEGRIDKKGLVFLFQGDSITDGNRGRNYKDPNHILGHGYPFSIASRTGFDFPEITISWLVWMPGNVPRLLCHQYFHLPGQYRFEV